MQQDSDFCQHHSGFEERFKLLCVKIDALEKLINVQINTAKESLGLARTDLNTRLHGMNELQARMDSMTTKFATKDEVKIDFKNISDTITLKLQPIMEKAAKWDDHCAAEGGQNTVKVVVITAFISVGVSAITFLLIYFLSKFLKLL